MCLYYIEYVSPLGYKLYAAEKDVKKFLESSTKNKVSVEVIEFPPKTNVLCEMFSRSTTSEVSSTWHRPEERLLQTLTT